MCGIAGFLDQTMSTEAAAGEALARDMADRIRHRGPDDSGVWADAAAGIFLAHRRLSILDLSPAGHQPMVSHSGRFVVVFNGEIYNHLELRKTLERESALLSWRGHSDTEVMLAAFERYGLRGALDRLVGMFAMAVWDRQARELILMRDRLGEKPIYWGRFGDVVVFGSELKALRASPNVKTEIDRDALTLFLRHNYIPAPYSIYKFVRKVDPGTLVRFASSGGEPIVESYWSARDVAVAGQDVPWPGSDSEAAEELERLVGQSVALQLEADVPVGAFLSGGVDSSLVVAMAQARSTRPVRTFSIGFEEDGYDEAQHAAAVARHLATDHTELYVSPAEAMAVIPRLPQIYDEPFSDSSQIPTFLVSQLARKHVTVSLSGDGGDELFAGYTRYLMGDRLWRLISALPRSSRGALATGLTSLSPGSWDRVARPLLALLPKRLRYANVGDKLYKLAGMLRANLDETYRNLVSHWTSPASIVLGAREPPTRLTVPDGQPTFDSFVERGAWLDLVSYLPDDILVKVDRAAMAVSLESRIPLLDHRVVEFAWRLPLNLKVRDGGAKWLLREILYRHVPKALLDRPKMGFGIPLDSWLRGPLRDWAETLLDESRLKREGYFDPGPIRQKWTEHLSGKRNWHYWLWDVLMFQAWLDCEKHRGRVAL
jgi:asparagine synthase (glutamine-hydrolysing)